MSGGQKRTRPTCSPFVARIVGYSVGRDCVFTVLLKRVGEGWQGINSWPAPQQEARIYREAE